MEEIICVICGSTDIKKLFYLPDLWLDRRDIARSYFKCNICKLIFQFPIPEIVDDLQLYPPEYSKAQQQSDPLSKYGLLKRCKVITRRKTTGNVLDIGCGTGTFIKAMRDIFGWEVHGIEPNPIIATVGQKQYNLDIKSVNIQNYNPPEKFDVVTLWDVFEHLSDPNEAIGKLRTFLKPEGFILLRIPNSESWDAKFFGRYWAGYDSPRHIFVYDIKNIELLLSKHCMKISHIQTNIGSNLNFIKSINFFLSGKQVNPSLREVVKKILGSLLVRPFLFPFSLIKEINHHGTSAVIIAKNI